MGEKDFTNREIILMFEQIKSELSHIKDQTTKTNGRLLKAEDKVEKLGSFQTKVMTVWGIAVGVLTLVINKFI
jgi:DNA anti-recombination protein RmuC